MPPAELRGLLLDIGGVVHNTGVVMVGRMTAVGVPWDDPGPAIETARKLLGLTKE